MYDKYYNGTNISISVGTIFKSQVLFIK